MVYRCNADLSHFLGDAPFCVPHVHVVHSLSFSSFFPMIPSSPDVLEAIFLEKARLHGIDEALAEFLFATASILYKPGRRELTPDVQKLARSLDHTYLTVTPVTPDNRLTDVQNVVRLCHEAGKYGTASVCIRPTKVALAKQLLDRWGVTDIAVCTVIDFPNAKGDLAGSAPPEKKAEEARIAQEQGATEFDVVIDYQAVLRGDFDTAYAGIAAVTDAVRSRDPGVIVKTILETAWLHERGGELAVADACNVAMDGGTDFVKTSTGYAPEGGATEEDVELLAELAHPRGVLVKAAGGIKTLPQLLALRKAGADRFGLSASVKVLEEALARGTRD